MGITAVGLAFSIASAVVGFAGEMAAAKTEKNELKLQRDMARLNAIREENDRREEYRRINASQRAIAAATGFDAWSGSYRAIHRGDRDLLERDIRYLRTGALANDAQFKSSLKALNTSTWLSGVGAAAEIGSSVFAKYPGKGDQTLSGGK